MGENKFNIAFCVSKKYSVTLPEVILSIAYHTRVNVNFFIIYTDELADGVLTKVENVCSAFNKRKERLKFKLIKFDLQKALFGNVDNKDILPFKGSYDTYLRLFLTDILYPLGVNNCLSLDADVIVNSDDFEHLLTYLNTIEYVGGCLDTGAKNVSKLYKEGYINAGVLVLNLQNLFNINYVNKSIEFIRNNYDKLILCEQDILNNVLCQKMISYLPRKYNQFSEFHNDNDQVSKACILHYVGEKPWTNSNSIWNKKKFIWIKYHWALFFVLYKVTPPLHVLNITAFIVYSIKPIVKFINRHVIKIFKSTK